MSQLSLAYVLAQMELAIKLANTYDLAITPLSSDYSGLVLTSEYLGLTGGELTQDFYVNFAEPKLTYRALSKTPEALVKACGVQNGCLQILDCTGGFGLDSFILQHYGAKVTLLERELAIYLLLNDGIQRAGLTDTMQALHVDAVDFLANSNQFDVIYLDPIRPQEKSKVKNKHSIEVLRSLVKQPGNYTNLITTALSTPQVRVVIKLGKHEQLTVTRKPTFTLAGKNTKFLVFINY